MILENTLAVAPALRWIGVSLLCLFVFSVFLITAGDALFRRLQRNQIKRELKKLKWVPLAVFLTMFVALPAAYAQTSEQASPQTQAETRQHLLVASSALMKHLKLACASEECQTLADQGLKMFAEAQQKLARNEMSDEEFKSFNAGLRAHMEKVREAILKSKTVDPTNVAQMKVAAPQCKTKFENVIKQSPCEQCTTVFERLALICSLYAVSCPSCFIACEALAIEQYSECLDTWC